MTHSDDPATGNDRFNDGRTAASRPAIALLAGDRLEIRDPEGNVLDTWQIADMVVIDENALTGTMTFASAEGEGSRLVLGPSDARAALLASHGNLQRWKRRRGMRELRAVAIWSAVMIAIVGAGYLGWRPLAGLIATAFPQQWEERLGETIRAALTDTWRTCSDRDGVAALEALVARIAPESLDGTPITIDIVRQGAPNALALPGNHILVFEGLIAEADSPEMVAAVLAHEIGHLDLDHPTRRLVEQLGLGLIFSVAFGGSDIGSAGMLLAGLSYSREAEGEADDRAIELLGAAGIRSDGLARFFTQMDKDHPLDIPDWLSTHPDLAARAAANPGSAEGDSGLDDESWGQLQAACGRAIKGE